MPLFTTNDVAQATARLKGSAGPVVVIPVYNAPDDVARCLASVLAHTPVCHPILVIDDASPDPTTLDAVLAVDDSVEHLVLLLRHEQNTGFVGSCNDAFVACAGNDVILVNSDVVVAAEWIERMTAAGRSSNTVATVSTLTNHGTILSVPERNTPGPLPAGLTVDEAARRVAAASKSLHPVLPTGVGHCMLVTRAALDAVGGFDPIFAPGYGEEVDFCQRAACRGFINVLADDVFVYHRGGSSFGLSPEKQAMQEAHDRIVDARYPNYLASVGWAADSDRSALAVALATARRSLVGTSIAVDGFCLGADLMGTQRFVIETAVALAEQADVAEVVLFVPPDVPDHVHQATAEHPRLIVRPLDGYAHIEEHFDAAVRPYQVDHVDQLRWMRSIASVSVITQLDLIAYHNPAYFKTPEHWNTYREITEFAFDTVDGVAFISEHSLQESLREGLLGPYHQRAVTYCGLDHRSGLVDGVCPPDLSAADAGFLLVLGANYLHKNRVFAMEVWALLRERGSSARLVLAGATPPNGNTSDEEDAWLEAHLDLAPDVVRMGSTSEAEKTWLLEHAGLVVYPTITEGFGMVPFEAALSGTPALTTRQGALDEVLPAALACIPTLVPADSVELADRLLHDAAFRAEQLRLLAEAARRFTWADSAMSLTKLVARTLDAPAGRRSFGAPTAKARPTRALEGMVRSLRRAPLLHRVLIGTDTRRQRALRRAANWVRRRAA